MKTILIAIFACTLCFTAKAQTDFSKVKDTITLAQDQHLFLIGFMGDIKSASRINYLMQVRSQFDSTNQSKPITVIVEGGLVVSLYSAMTSQPEGVTSDYNNAIKAALMPQIKNAWVGAQIMQIATENVTRRLRLMEQAKELILSIQL